MASQDIRSGGTRRLWRRAAAGLAAMSVIWLVAFPSFAQVSGLTAEQQRMLNQLPASQREEALKALAQYKATQPGNTVEPLKEEASSPAPETAQPVAAEPAPAQTFAAPNSRLVIQFTPKEELTPEETTAISEDPLQSRLIGDHSFVLDGNGVLSLFGVQSIPLLGLSEGDIERRLAAEPLLAPFDINVRILTTQATGVAALKPFGYELFESSQAGFEPPTTGPVPPDYVLGPGDTVRVQLFGNVNGIYEYDVTRDGTLNLPEIGPMTVAGLPFSEFRDDVNRRVKESLIGTQVSVTMGQLRTMRVFVLGDANRPGSYIVESLATISSALYRSGGISPVGTLRDIQLKRQGKIVARLDLYDLLLRGDTSGDIRLQPGDVIFVPPVGAQVSVSGAVKRPAIYETSKGASVADVINLAGGLRADAYPEGGRIERIEAGEQRVVLDVNLADKAGLGSAAYPGDVLTIPQVLPDLEDTVTLVGQVQRPGPYEWHSGMKLTDLLGSLADLQPGADSDYVLIRRENGDERRVSAISANLAAALAQPQSTDNLLLQPRDTVYVFSLAFGRQRVITPILDELKLQSRFGEPYGEVSVTGQVKAPGVYPLEPRMHVSDLVRAGGNLSEQAYALGAELVRYSIVDGGYRQTNVIDVDLGAIRRGDTRADLELQEHDNLRISRLPDWDSLWTVTLDGEVKFPGQYRIRRNETLGELLKRAGGLTDEAFPEGAIFLRESLKEREQEQIEGLAQRIQADLTSLSLEQGNPDSAASLQTGQSLLNQLRQTEAVGRLVIDLDQIIAAGQGKEMVLDLELRDGDQLLVPKRANSVTVIGETQQHTSLLYQPGLSRDDYIKMSGGVTRHADKKLIYIVRASGAVVASNSSNWFGRGSGMDMRPGDTIVVPLATDRMRPLTFWGSVTQILYQGAIAVAAVRSFQK